MAQKNWKSTVLSVLDKYDLSSSQHDPDKLGEDFEKFLRSQGLQKNDGNYNCVFYLLLDFIIFKLHYIQKN